MQLGHCDGLYNWVSSKDEVSIKKKKEGKKINEKVKENKDGVHGLGLVDAIQKTQNSLYSRAWSYYY